MIIQFGIFFSEITKILLYLKNFKHIIIDKAMIDVKLIQDFPKLIPAFQNEIGVKIADVVTYRFMMLRIVCQQMYFYCFQKFGELSLFQTHNPPVSSHHFLSYVSIAKT